MIFFSAILFFSGHYGYEGQYARLFLIIKQNQFHFLFFVKATVVEEQNSKHKNTFTVYQTLASP